MKLKVIDIVIILSLVGSVGFIGFRMLRGKKAVPVITAVVPPSPAPAPAPAQALGSLYGQPVLAAFGQQPKMEAAAWSALVAGEKLVTVDQTEACRETGAVPSSTYPNVSKELNGRLLQNKGGILPRYGGLRCHRVGQALHVSFFGGEDSDYYVEKVGEFTVTEIVELDREKVSNDFWSALGVSRDQLTSRFTKMTLLRVEMVAGGKEEPVGIPDFHFRYSQLSEATLGRLQGKKATVLDLRNASARAALPIPNSVALEFPVAGTPLKTEKFRWDVRVSDLKSSPANLAPLATTPKDQTIVVVGNDGEDGRPFWLLRDLSNLAYENVFWYSGKVDKLRSVLQP